MKRTIFLWMMVLLASCGKENRTFSLKTIRLNEYSRSALPATFGIHPHIPMTLYNRTFRFQLWGDVSGFVGGCEVDMRSYKIIFPIDMEVKSDSVGISIVGSWE